LTKAVLFVILCEISVNLSMLIKLYMVQMLQVLCVQCTGDICMWQFIFVFS